MHLAVLLSSILAGVASATKTPIDAGLLATLERYAAFASAAYSSDCSVPPYGSVVETYINDIPTSTQATLFRDDAAEEYIISFRGTSDIQDFLTDLDQDLISCVAPGLECLGCTVCKTSLIRCKSPTNRYNHSVLKDTSDNTMPSPLKSRAR